MQVSLKSLTQQNINSELVLPQTGPIRLALIVRKVYYKSVFSIPLADQQPRQRASDPTAEGHLNNPTNRDVVITEPAANIFL